MAHPAAEHDRERRYGKARRRNGCRHKVGLLTPKLDSFPLSLATNAELFRFFAAARDRSPWPCTRRMLVPSADDHVARFWGS
jgi:hypothetical protein